MLTLKKRNEIQSALLILPVTLFKVYKGLLHSKSSNRPKRKEIPVTIIVREGAITKPLQGSFNIISMGENFPNKNDC